MSEWSRIYYQNNKEKIKKRAREWQQKNKKKFHKYQKEYQRKRYSTYPWLRTFKNVRQRCTYIKDKKFKYYGGKGIKCLITKNEIKYLWHRDNANLMKHPSIDRKNVKGDYTLENCQFIEMEENRVKERC